MCALYMLYYVCSLRIVRAIVIKTRLFSFSLIISLVSTPTNDCARRSAHTITLYYFVFENKLNLIVSRNTTTSQLFRYNIIILFASNLIFMWVIIKFKLLTI